MHKATSGLGFRGESHVWDHPLNPDLHLSLHSRSIFATLRHSSETDADSFALLLYQIPVTPESLLSASARGRDKKYDKFCNLVSH